MQIKKNIPLILGISIPILMILFVLGSIYLPGIFVHPKFNFLYVVGGNNYIDEWQYLVQNGELVKSKINQSRNKSYNPPYVEAKLFVYDVLRNESREISFEEAQKLNFDSNIKSPDGFEIVYGSRGENALPFFYVSEIDYNSRYLKGHGVSKKINIQSSEGFYYTFRFLGWIKQ